MSPPAELDAFRLRPIAPSDDPAVAAIIRAVMPEFGACGRGFAIEDPEVDRMSATYAAPRSAYWVIEGAGAVLGGGGIAPLKGGDEGTCELQKMYFLPAARGRGLGRRLLETCLARARELGFRRCYLETLTGMEAAQRLYLAAGFRKIPGPLGSTGHFSCDTFYLRDL
jgi:putative acetyltransferase